MPKLLAPLNTGSYKQVPGVITSASEYATKTLSSNTKLNVYGKEISVSWDDFLFQARLGRGAFGTVDKMLLKSGSSRLDMIFAVKTIDLCNMGVKAENIKRESEIGMGIIHNDFAVANFGFMKKDADVRIVMEIMDTSVDKIHTYLEAPVPEKEIMYITKCVITGLEFLCNELDILHRDVKPSNILADRRGNVKICDYGVSKQMVADVTLTRNVGSCYYQAPERHATQEIEGGFDSKSDIWSLGITIYELITNRNPFNTGNEFEAATQISNSSNIELPAEEQSISQGLRDIVKHCLKRDRRERSSYTELLMLPVLMKKNLTAEKPAFGNFINYILTEISIPSQPPIIRGYDSFCP